MPDYEPNVDAPETYWAGEYDAQQIADATGASWAAPIFALNQPRVINIADLCSAPPPSAPSFTTTDLVLALNPFADNTALRQKLSDYTDAGLHRSFCTAVDVPPLPPMPSNPPPADLPPGPIPVTDKAHKDDQMYAWLKWMVREITPRSYHGGPSQDVTDEGHWTIPIEFGGQWSVYAVGVEVTVTAQPPDMGRTMGGDFPVWYDFGWITLETGGMGQSPVRLQHDNQVLTHSVPKVNGVYWNLTPGVEVHLRALYPDTAEEPGEG